MRILYGVQATGNGHISRARAMAEALSEHAVDVTWLFSGRERSQLFDMAPFGDFLHRRGLTFVTQGGSVRHWQTLRENHLPQFLRDVRALPLAGFDLVVTDFEPVTAWAGRRAGVPTIGIGHQYAFGPATPLAGDHWLARQIMRRFAPVERPVGLHWHPYSDDVLPPILDLPDCAGEARNHVLVYLPFEDQVAVSALLQQFPATSFRLYGPGLSIGEESNVSLRPTSVATFKRDLASCSGVICNSGFELISECLQWHKPVLTKPLAGQVEQLSNARALGELGHATIVNRLDRDSLEPWLLRRPAPPLLRYPDVAAALAGWLAAGACSELATLQHQLWRDTARGFPVNTCTPALPTRLSTTPLWRPVPQRPELGKLASLG
ncbi:glycosyltransferase family protein [Haliea sp. E1-2-M8]|uniref:MJ1255/VC2487 family glycosyltransferase n=1 Tax=Haliea sp. E1-2-M8 TaxID=3064706 RepID=UPI00271F5A76|nr:MJ1255/VC2487 family glycosyltransferase [Haliea sp. E1-2-M8]MDO8862753.1 glycosyltransferase family protein [Haliea sp. E1-2-M8]